ARIGGRSTRFLRLEEANRGLGVLVFVVDLEGAAVHGEGPAAHLRRPVELGQREEGVDAMRMLLEKRVERLFGALRPVGVLHLGSGKGDPRAEPHSSLELRYRRLEKLYGVPVAAFAM